MSARDEIRTETDDTRERQSGAERHAIESQPVRADQAEAQHDESEHLAPERPGTQHEYAMDSVGGEPTEPTLEDVESPERDSGEPGERAGAPYVDRRIRRPESEPDRDEFAARADPTDGDEGR